MPMTSSETDLAATADRVLQDPNLLEQLLERVYELMREDLRIQQERVRHYRTGKGML